jgi:sugar phosphate isomerase/epimerase
VARHWSHDLRLALDPYTFRAVPLTKLRSVLASLSYHLIELSPRDDFLPFFVYPRAYTRQIRALALPDAGVGVASVLPLNGWSSPDEHERVASVRYWNRAIAWEDRAEESSRSMLPAVTRYLEKFPGSSLELSARPIT